MKSLPAYNACIEEILREKDTPRSLKDAVEWSASFFSYHTLTHPRPKALWRNEIFKSSRPSVL